MRFAPAHAALIALLLLACSGGTEPIDESPSEAGPTTTDSEEFQGDPQDYLAALVACYREAGWDAEIVDGDGLRVPSVTEGQRDAFEVTVAECEQQLGAPPMAPPLDEEQIRDHYDALLEAAECLRQEGIDVEPPPSVERFIDTWDADGGGWHPHQSIDSGAPGDWEQLNERCPQPRSG